MTEFQSFGFFFFFEMVENMLPKALTKKLRKLIWEKKKIKSQRFSFLDLWWYVMNMQVCKCEIIKKNRKFFMNKSTNFGVRSKTKRWGVRSSIVLKKFCSFFSSFRLYVPLNFFIHTLVVVISILNSFKSYYVT